MITGLSSTYEPDEFCTVCGTYLPDHADDCPCLIEEIPEPPC